MSGSIAVVGATGQQGGSVVDALLKQGKFQVVALTRDPSSKQAKALVDRGNARVVQGDLNDEASLAKAFEGTSGVFLVTDRGTGTDPEEETQQGVNAIVAAKKAGVGHLVWSGLEDPRPIIKGRLPESSPGHIVPHLESKAAVSEYLKQAGLRYTILITSLYYSNLATATQYRKQPDGSFTFALNGGTKAQPMFSVEDLGETVAAIFADPERYNGTTVPVVGEYISYAGVAEIVSEVTGRTVKYSPLTYEQAAALPNPRARAVANMMQYMVDWDNAADLRPVDKALVHGNTFKKWALEHSEELKAAVAKGDV